MKRILLIAVLLFGLSAGVYAQTDDEITAERIAMVRVLAELGEAEPQFVLGISYE